MLASTFSISKPPFLLYKRRRRCIRCRGLNHNTPLTPFISNTTLRVQDPLKQDFKARLICTCNRTRTRTRIVYLPLFFFRNVIDSFQPRFSGDGFNGHDDGGGAYG